MTRRRITPRTIATLAKLRGHATNEAISVLTNALEQGLITNRYVQSLAAASNTTPPQRITTMLALESILLSLARRGVAPLLSDLAEQLIGDSPDVSPAA